MYLLKIEGAGDYNLIHQRLETLFAEARQLGVDAIARPQMAEDLATAWKDLSQVEDLAVYLKGGLIQIFRMDLAEYDLDGRQLKLWERDQIGTDKVG